MSSLLSLPVEIVAIIVEYVSYYKLTLKRVCKIFYRLCHNRLTYKDIILMRRGNEFNFKVRPAIYIEAAVIKKNTNYTAHIDPIFRSTNIYIVYGYTDMDEPLYIKSCNLGRILSYPDYAISKANLMFDFCKYEIDMFMDLCIFNDSSALIMLIKKIHNIATNDNMIELFKKWFMILINKKMFDAACEFLCVTSTKCKEYDCNQWIKKQFNQAPSDCYKIDDFLVYASHYYPFCTFNS